MWPGEGFSYPPDRTPRQKALDDLGVAVYGEAVAFTFVVCGVVYVLWGLSKLEILGCLIIFCLAGVFYLVSRHDKKEALLALQRAEVEESAKAETDEIVS